MRETFSITLEGDSVVLKLSISSETEGICELITPGGSFMGKSYEFFCELGEGTHDLALLSPPKRRCVD